MRSKGTKTKYPGVKKLDADTFYLRARITDPRTGQKKEVDKVVEASSDREAASLRTEMIRSFETGPRLGRQRIGDFARSWIESKARIVDSHTVDGYRTALEEHILPELGDVYYDSLRPADVQEWVNRSLKKTWTKHGAKGKTKRYRYSVTSVHSWFRVLRNVTRDAVHQLDLPRDATARVAFPDRHSREGTNAISGEKLGLFLDIMKKKYPRNYALAATLAFTGLRFCHASALKWEDIDEVNNVIHVERKQRTQIVGAVSRRKRAPRELPLVPELLAVLREHKEQFSVKPAQGVGDGWIFLSEVGTLRSPGSLVKAWTACAKAAGITARFTVHGLRRTFNDLTRRAGVDAIVTKAMTGHVTEDMREHYSSVDITEKRSAVASVLRLVPRSSDGQVGEWVGEERKPAAAS